MFIVALTFDANATFGADSVHIGRLSDFIMELLIQWRCDVITAYVVSHNDDDDDAHYYYNSRSPSNDHNVR